MRIFKYVFLVIITLMMINNAAQAKPTYHLYLDADQTGAKASGVSIEQGIRTALHQVNNTLGGMPVKLIVKDHHGSSLRSKRHLEEFLNDPQALAIFSGLHSPPLLNNLAFINENKILLLDPWAAAGPITRYSKGENWIYRLSIDDSKAGNVIVNSAIKEGFTKPFLLLEETGWGRSNFNTMKKALAQQGLKAEGTKWFNWNLGKTSAKMIFRDIAATKADCILMVANAHEGKTFAKALLSLPKAIRLPIRSHWGITGGDFPEIIHAQSRKGIDLKFLQTRFSFISSPSTPFNENVFNNAKHLFPALIQSKQDITAPTGFIHAYDLTKLLIRAIKKSQLKGDIIQKRYSIRQSLETLNSPIKGLIKTYKMPFTKFTKSSPDAHEALAIEDFVMAYYGDNNQIILDERP